VPVTLALDALRTVRSGLAPGIVASGSATGKLTYAPKNQDKAAPDQIASKQSAHRTHTRTAKALPAVEGPLTGSIAIEGFQLSGNGLGEPVRVAKLLLEPSPSSAPMFPDGSQTLVSTVAIPAGGTSPLTVSTRVSLSGYHVTLRGQASIARARELAHVAGIANVAALDSLAGEPLSLDLTGEGPWMPTLLPTQMPARGLVRALTANVSAPAVSLPHSATDDSLTGTVTLRNANWKTEYLVNHVEISQATLHMDGHAVRWDPVVFSYGPLKGTASLSLPVACEAPQPCVPEFEIQFGALDAAVLQTSFLGAHERGTLLSTLIERLRPTAAPAWPRLNGTIKAESLVLGPVMLHEAAADISTVASGAEIKVFDAELLGGHIHGAGTFHAAQTPKDKPSYALEGQFEKLSPLALGQLLGLRSSGGVIEGNGKIELAGFTGDDLAASAKGTVHFEWHRGAVVASSGSAPVPPALARFDSWTADGEIANGSLTLKDNQVKHGIHTEPVQAAVTLAEKPKIAFPAIKPAQAKR